MKIDGKVNNKELLSKVQGCHHNYKHYVMQAYTRIRQYLTDEFPLDDDDSIMSRSFVRLYSLDHDTIESDIKVVLMSTKFLSYRDVSKFELEFDLKLVKIFLENRNMLSDFKYDSSFDSLFNQDKVVFFYHFRRLNGNII